MTRLDDLKARGTATENQIKQTEEYKQIKNSYDPIHLLAACILYLRGDFNTADWGSLDEAFGAALDRAKWQRQVDHTAWREFVREPAVTMRWQPSGPVMTPYTNNDFVNLILGQGNVNVRSGRCVMNCWEAVITAAMFDQRLTNPGRLNQIYTGNPNAFTAELVHAFSRDRHDYLPQPGNLLGTPIPGDIVFFDGLGHVALATEQPLPGRPYNVPGIKIISFWPAPAADNFGPGTAATVEVTTIESILHYAKRHNMGDLPVSFGSPDWHALNG